MTKKPCPFSRARVHELYWHEGKSLTAIAAIAASIDDKPVHATTAARWLRDYQIKTRSKQEAWAARQHLANPNLGKPKSELQVALTALSAGSAGKNKYCPGCQTKKPPEAFYKEAKRPGSLSSNCKECKKKRNRANWKERYYPAHKSSLIATVTERRNKILKSDYLKNNKKPGG